ncbi:MAG: hypothetical protein JO299_07355, partial [Gammaproteobacteria bacterium]|nr:hypothetical protein [Gammaproteobacteria bacterium]
SRELCEALVLLQQQPPAELQRESPPAIVEWGCANWRPELLAAVREVRAGDH